MSSKSPYKSMTLNNPNYREGPPDYLLYNTLHNHMHFVCTLSLTLSLTICPIILFIRRESSLT